MSASLSLKFGNGNLYILSDFNAAHFLECHLIIILTCTIQVHITPKKVLMKSERLGFYKIFGAKITEFKSIL